MNEDELYQKLEQLEKDRIAYLEVDDNAGAKRKEKQIEKINIQLELLKFNKLKKELEIYKKVCKDYPEIQMRISELKEE